MQQHIHSILTITLFAFLTCILLTGCQDILVKELDIEEDFDYISELGLSGTLSNNYGDSTFPAFSRFLLAENQSIVEQVEDPTYYDSDALNLYKNGDYYNTFTNIGDGNHINQNQGSNLPSFTFDSGDYRIEVDHPEFGLVSAETQMPDPVFLNSIEVDSFNFGGLDDDESRFIVTLEFDDPPGDNYYKVSLLDDIDVVFMDTLIYGEDTLVLENYLYGYIESFNVQGAQEGYNGGYSFDDSIFDDSAYTFTFNMVVGNGGGNGGGNIDLDFIEEQFSVRWSCLSESQYNFERSYTNYQNSQDFGPFSEPVSLYTNVNNGLGYFGAENYYDAKFME